MRIEAILTDLQEAGLSEVQKIEYDKEFVVRFYYDFDQDEMNAAKAYSSDETDYEVETTQWYEEGYLPYLNELAVDNVAEVIQEIMEDHEVEAQFVSYEASVDNKDFSEFIAVFFEKDKEVDIDEIIDELEL